MIKKIWTYRKGKWALSIICFFGVMALFADFLANDKPIYCQYEGESYYPIFNEYGTNLGLVKPYTFLNRKSWQDLPLEKYFYPLIKFDATDIDRNSKAFASPGTIIPSFNFNKKYLLGSDALGRDLAAGIVQGSRKTLLIAFLAMLISCLIGFFLGIVAGYFGDDKVHLNVWVLLLFCVSLFVVWFQWSFDLWSFTVTVFWSFGLAIVALMLNKAFHKKQIMIPLDNIIMRVIEVFKSIPALFILLALLALIAQPTVLTVILIIGLLRWPTITRVMRAEIFKIKSKDFVTSARALGLTNYQIIRSHILPNAIPPLMTIIAFGFASTILLEATISFLGIGLGASDITWGSILSSARSNFSAWWIAVFPGMAIFLMVIACNYLGDTLNEINLSST